MMMDNATEWHELFSTGYFIGNMRRVQHIIYILRRVCILETGKVYDGLFEHIKINAERFLSEINRYFIV